jgi:hypothetical protein
MLSESQNKIEEAFQKYRETPEGHGSVRDIFNAGYDSRQSEITALEARVKQLEVNLTVCKNDYWFMANLLEYYSSDKEQAIKDCIERMKFREPIFNVLASRDKLSQTEIT